MEKIVVVINPSETAAAEIADVKFITGPQGPRGYSVSGTEFVEADASGNYVYNLVFEDGDTASFTSPKGPQGEQGIPGDDTVYVGPDPAPAGTTVQIDPNGDPIDLPAMIAEIAAEVVEVYMRASGGYIQYSMDGETWENIIATADLKGDPGQDGADGYTPVKGTDYWTAQDQASIVSDVLSALPTWSGGSY